MTAGGDLPAYVILTPLRNEKAHFGAVIEGVMRQTRRPALWLVLDDGSRDGSGEMAETAARGNAWMRVVRLPDRGRDLVGEGVAGLMNLGLSLIEDVPADYVAKLDADVDLPPDYFSTLIEEMRRDPGLGIASGHPYALEGGRRLLERHADFFPSGTARLYRRALLREIGGFVPSVGWDTVDILKMRMRGAGTRVLHSVEYHHRRRMGTRNGPLDGAVRDGRNAYLTGYGPLFFLLRAAFNVRYRPYLLRTFGMLWGFTQGYVERPPRIVTAEERAFHLRLQRRRLLLQPID